MNNSEIDSRINGNWNINEPWNISVTQHSIIRFMERGGNSNISSLAAASRLRAIVATGKEMVLKNPVLEVKHMLNHDMKKARFFREGKLIVVLDETNTIVTVHRGEAQSWKEKP